MAWSLSNLGIVELARQGVMGMNRRNISYISKYNPRQFFPLVDDKLQTKRLAIEHGVKVPRLIGVIDNQHDVRRVTQLVKDCSGFCIKPSKGSGGKGILVIAKAEEENYYRTNGQRMTRGELERHVSNILAGLFSLGGAVDAAMIEELIVGDPILANYSYEGVPDVRVIVFRGIPAMAMMRLSCAASHGKANLHQGAVGVGIDIGTGQAVNAVQRDKDISLHPDTEQDLKLLQVPQWETLLQLACACYDMTGLGYLGVDLVLDKNMGPTLLELNARPGLSIQIANRAGLLPRLRKIETISRPQRMSIDARIEFARAAFSVVNTAGNTAINTTVSPTVNTTSVTSA